jgi:hypothetical protein
MNINSFYNEVTSKLLEKQAVSKRREPNVQWRPVASQKNWYLTRTAVTFIGTKQLLLLQLNIVRWKGIIRDYLH